MLKESPPRVEGGNIAVTVDEDEYAFGVAEFRYSLFGRLVLSKGVKPIKIKDLKKRLSTIWRIKEEVWKLIPLGKGHFNLRMQSRGEKSKAFSIGALFLKSRVFRVSEW